MVYIRIWIFWYIYKTLKQLEHKLFFLTVKLEFFEFWSQIVFIYQSEIIEKCNRSVFLWILGDNKSLSQMKNYKINVFLSWFFIFFIIHQKIHHVIQKIVREHRYKFTLDTKISALVNTVPHAWYEWAKKLIVRLWVSRNEAQNEPFF